MQDKSIKKANIAWDNTGFPLSIDFNDVYFSRENGLKEAYYVYLQQNDLFQRFSKLKYKQSFTIFETGFGSGLNFIAAWDLFEKIASEDAILNFISVEKFPLASNDLRKILKLWPILGKYADKLYDNYRNILHKRFNYLIFNRGRVRLTLIFDDICHVFSAISTKKIDAWFLDGFSPLKNPDMWSTDLFKNMAEISHSKTTYSTYTAAGEIKRGLANSGFSVNRIKGYGKKRHMIKGGFLLTQSISKPVEKIWLQQTIKQFNKKEAIVIGAGIAGCSTAIALADRGWKVKLLDKHEKIATQASGNRQLALYMRLSSIDTVLSDLLIQGYGYTLSLLNRILKDQKHVYWNSNGLIQVGFNKKEQQRQHRVITNINDASFVEFVSPKVLSKKTGISINESGLWFKRGGWVNAISLCESMLKNENISFRPLFSVQSLTYENYQWNVYSQDDVTITAPVVIIANSYSALSFKQTQYLPLKKIRGQVSYIRSTKESEKISSVLCGQSYILPAMNGIHTIGATYQFFSENLTVNMNDNKKNIYNLKVHFPSVYDALNASEINIDTVTGKAGIRCSTPDYLPIVGPVVDQQQFKQQFSFLSKNIKLNYTTEPRYIPGLYVNIGHGFRGLVTGPLSGEFLAALIDNDTIPVSNKITDALHPSRFLARKLIRNEI